MLKNTKSGSKMQSYPKIYIVVFEELIVLEISAITKLILVN